MVNWPPPSNNSIPPQAMSPLQKAASAPAQAAKPATPPASEPAATPAPAAEPTTADTSEVRGLNQSSDDPLRVNFTPPTTEAAATQATEAVGSSSSTSDAAERCEVLGRACQDLFTNGPKPDIVKGLSAEQRKEFEEAMFEALLFAHAETRP